MTRRYAKDNVTVYEIWWWYSQRVKAFTDPRIPAGWWHYGTFDTGQKIPKRARELYRTRRDLQDHFRAPFRAGDGYLTWLRQEGVIES